MPLTCPNCQRAISEELVDLYWKKTFCPDCQGDWFDCGQWIEEELIPGTNLNEPPEGAWFARSPGYFRVGLRSGSTNAFVPPILFSAMLLLFTVFVVSGAEPGSRSSLLRFFLIPWLFVLPWWIAGWLAYRAKVEVEVKNGSGTLSRTFGPFSWSRPFDWNRIEKIYLSKVSRKNQMGHGNRIALEGGGVITFAKGARMERLHFVLIALWRMQRERTLGSVAESRTLK